MSADRRSLQERWSSELLGGADDVVGTRMHRPVVAAEHDVACFDMGEELLFRHAVEAGEPRSAEVADPLVGPLRPHVGVTLSGTGDD